MITTLLACSLGDKLCALKKTFAIIIIFHVVYCSALYHTKHWNGLDETNDNTFFKKVFNRLYVCIVTQTSVGFGDISPKTFMAKIIVMLHMVSMLLSILLGIS